MHYHMISYPVGVHHLWNHGTQLNKFAESPISRKLFFFLGGGDIECHSSKGVRFGRGTPTEVTRSLGSVVSSPAGSPPSSKRLQGIA